MRRSSQRYYVVGAVIAKEVVRYDEAFEFLKEGLNSNGEYRVSLLYNLADVYLLVNQPDRAEPVANELIEVAPNIVGGYWKKAQILLGRGAFSEAISVLLQTPEGATLEETAQTQASLSIAYHLNGQHLESARSMQNAVKINTSSLENVYAVSAASRSLVHLGHLEAAQDLLSKHLSVSPDSAKVDEYINAALYVQSKSSTK